MKVMGYDPSLTSSGFAYTDVEDKVHTGRITPKRMQGPERLDYLEESFNKLIMESSAYLGGLVRLIAYEGYSMGRNARGSRAFSMGEGGGVVKLVAWRMGIDVLLVPPTSLKLFTTGSGGASKEDIISVVANQYGYNVTQDDEADAFMLMKMAEAFHTGRARLGHRRLGLDGCTLVKGKDN